jgi:hypothetical protein
MAFTNAEKASIRNFLGWNARWVQFDSALERAFAFVESASDGGDTSSEDLARSLLASITSIQTEIDGTHPRFKATQVGTIKLNPAEVAQLVDRGESYIGQLARVFGVPVYGRALRADLPTGGGGPWGPTGGGNAQRQG